MIILIALWWLAEQVLVLLAASVLGVIMFGWLAYVIIHAVVWERVTGLSYVDYHHWQIGMFDGMTQAERFAATGRRPWDWSRKQEAQPQ